NRLAILSALADDQANALKAAYTPDRLGVVTTTQSILRSHTHSKEHSDGTGQSDEQQIGVVGDVSLGQGQEHLNFGPLPTGGAPFTGVTLTTGSPGSGSIDLQEGTSGQDTTSRGSAHEHQKIINTD